MVKKFSQAQKERLKKPSHPWNSEGKVKKKERKTTSLDLKRKVLPQEDEGVITFMYIDPKFMIDSFQHKLKNGLNRVKYLNKARAETMRNM